MDSNEFFRRATLAICGNLEIEKALGTFAGLLSDVMPVDHIFLECWDEGLGTMKTIAVISENESRRVDLITPLSAKAKAEIQQKHLCDAWQEVSIHHDTRQDLVTREMLAFHQVRSNSLILLNLGHYDAPVGSLVVSTQNGIHTQKDADLLKMLREPLKVAVVNTLKHMEVTLLKDIIADDNRYLHDELRRLSGDEIVGAGTGLKTVMDNVRQVALLDSPVLITGETGTGKDVIAGAIHFYSHRRSGPYIAVNCGAIPESLMDSELFGHEKGAFTGAIAQKRGRFERANKGTILLDEVGELPSHAQVRLLRVLQNRELERVGGDRTLSLDIRVIAATNRNLEQMVKDGQFREDLWYRLNVFPIWIPPLRERTFDIPILVHHCLQQKARELKLTEIPLVLPGAMETLMQYSWPGNVRELQNVVERALILNPRGPLSFDHLWQRSFPTLPQTEPDLYQFSSLDEHTAQYIRQVLRKTNGKIYGPGGAAEILKIHPSTLRNRMDKLNISYHKHQRG